MEGLGLLVGHLFGDYILQNDWMAKNKTNPHPGKQPFYPDGYLIEWKENRVKWITGFYACTVHCLLYTLSVWLFSFWWMPTWGLIVCFLLHWPIDRFRLAKFWMTKVAGQKEFASGPLSPWSIIIVDNIFHIIVLFLIGFIAL